MQNRHRLITIIVANLLVLAFLIGLPAAKIDFIADWLPITLFGILIVFTMTFGMPLAGGMISLLPMVAVAAYLRFGLVTTGWLVFVSAWVHGLFRYFFTEHFKLPFPAAKLSDLMDRAAVNAVMVTASILVGGYVFEYLGGAHLAADGSYPVFLPALGVSYFFVNYALAAIYFLILGGGQHKLFLRSLPTLLLYEATPVLFAPLITLIYSELGALYFFLLILALVIITFIVRDLNEIGLRLNRRVEELDSLQIVGQALSASLEVEAIMSAIHVQVARLMPASAFFVALYEKETGEVSFPLAFEKGAPVKWRSRRAGNGFTEYVLRTRRPLLVRRDVVKTAVSLGLDQIGKEAKCWLGVPILLADEPIGVMAVQSFTQPNVYDDRHLNVLVTIATQAALAIQNARLYARTGSALAQRVQELDSIFRATRDGILLFSKEWRVLATNRAFTEIVVAADIDWVGQSVINEVGETGILMSHLEYTQEELERDCNAIYQGEKLRKSQIVIEGMLPRYIERTLVPVHDQGQEISGWLLILRDITEEVKLAQIREDMTHMVVHDLRSPLSVTLGSLETIQAWLEKGYTEDVQRLLELAQVSGERMLQLLNDLLDTYKLESGELPLNLEPVPILPLLNEVMTHFESAANEAEIKIEAETAPDMPLLSGDREHLLRVLSNLVDNAIKFTPNNGRIRLWAQPALDGMVLVGVCDTGAGIPIEEQSEVFLKFRQNKSVQSRRPGSGLGLTYCKLVVEAHGGRIWAESEGIGLGSAFMMELPAFEGVERSLYSLESAEMRPC